MSNSISYGINFDTRLDDKDPPEERDTPYRCVSGTSTLENPPTDADDKKPDVLYATEIKEPGRFILLSEADTQGPDPAEWTGGRISMGAIVRDGSDTPPGNAPIPDRHNGYANVLFADMSIGVLDVDETVPTDARRNVNANTPLWTLPAD